MALLGVAAGHTSSWGRSHPEVLTPCWSSTGTITDQLGPMDPTAPSTFKLLSTLLTEAAHTFPDRYMHVGGDEVDASCWQVCECRRRCGCTHPACECLCGGGFAGEQVGACTSDAWVTRSWLGRVTRRPCTAGRGLSSKLSSQCLAEQPPHTEVDAAARVAPA